MCVEGGVGAGGGEVGGGGIKTEVSSNLLHLSVVLSVILTYSQPFMKIQVAVQQSVICARMTDDTTILSHSLC